MTDPQATSLRIEWQHCGYGADESGAHGCLGAQVSAYEECLAHLDEGARQAYLASLRPGEDVDHRGTLFSQSLFAELLDAVSEGDGRAYFRKALFDAAEFEGDVNLANATFHGEAAFRRVRFHGKAVFSETQFRDISSFKGSTFASSAHFPSAQFAKPARFSGVKFLGHAGFNRSRFSNVARFDSAEFSDVATFTKAVFSHDANFSGARFAWPSRFIEAHFDKQADFSKVEFAKRVNFTEAAFVGSVKFDDSKFVGRAEFSATSFSADVNFEGVHFLEDALFKESSFEKLSHFGPVVCSGEVDMSFAVFKSPSTLEISSIRLDCRRTRFEVTASLSLRYSTVDFTGAVLGQSVSISAGHTAFERPSGGPVRENFRSGRSEEVKIVSLRGVDVSHLVLTDIDLSNCRFSGSLNLDKLRIEGRSKFATTPRGLQRRFIFVPSWWTRRNTIAEEHYWRAAEGSRPEGWSRAPANSRQERPVRPDDLAGIYRQLRKSLEDSKDEPGAADFYYGEMEARRKNREKGSVGERVLLSAYWALSGYGIRASRAFGWLTSMLVISVLVMMLCGIPGNSPREITSGTYTGNSVNLSTVPEKPVLGEGVDRFTWRRFERSSRTVANAIVFRSAEQRLTSLGVAMEFICRVFGPLLLALSILAIRGRVKR
ncbi:pentapeptide repeat-containing protein [Streptomyces sp. NPDC057253]|uniref:pentapeptide repeat-containing protein n=1 Tax=Streptomyces sp. NPDC057253 TaxID=3346069 RepID=UPI003634E902